jgi:hypothetical protein
VSPDDAYKVAFAIISSVVGTSVFIVGLSSWLGKVWAKRILQQYKLKYGSEMGKNPSYGCY